MDVNQINPFVSSASNVFNTMLGCPIKRQTISLKDNHHPTYDITAVIGLSGKISGSVVFSLSEKVAFQAVEALLGTTVHEIDADVIDAVGELINMIAGGAKVNLAQYELSLGLPNVIVGKDHTICFPGNVQPLFIPFETQWGPFSLEIGLDNSSVLSEDGAMQSAAT